MHEEPREKLHLILLKNLHYLAKTVAHLWTNDNINNFISYTNDQKENCLILERASEILCTLSQQSNVYFYFVFNTSDNLELEQKPDMKSSNERNLVDNKVLKCLIEGNVFHENNQIAFNFCLFSTTLLVFQSKNIKKLDENNRKMIEDELIIDSNYLFDLAKNGLFAIILQCNQRLQNKQQPEDIKLLKVIQINLN